MSAEVTKSKNMGDLPEWICWRAELREGKATKVPYSPESGSHARSSDDPSMWAPSQRRKGPLAREITTGSARVFLPDAKRTRVHRELPRVKFSVANLEPSSQRGLNAPQARALTERPAPPRKSSLGQDHAEAVLRLNSM